MESETAHFAVPLKWNDDPSEQLRALRDEVLKQKDCPKATTAAFMITAWNAIEHLPPDWFPPESSETLTLISRFFYLDGQTQPAIESAARAVRSAVLGKHRNLEMVARTRHGIALRLAFDFGGSARELVSAIEIAREVGAADQEAKSLNSLGNTYNDAGLQHEALALFERAATFFESTGDHLSAWMALDNAALAAKRLGDIDQAIKFIERADGSWRNKPRNADEKLWFVQGAITRCELLIQVDRIEEALECARMAHDVAEDSGIGVAREFAGLCEGISRFAAGIGTKEALDRIVDSADGPSSYWIALDTVIRTYEKTGHFDDALAMQQRLLEFTKAQKLVEVRRLGGRGPSPEEIEGAARLARLSQEIQRRITGLIEIAINQSLRAGHDHARVFRLGRLTELFSASLGWSNERSEQIALAAKLIDIGNIILPSKLLTKHGDLSRSEQALVVEPVKFGADLLANTRLELLHACVPIVRYRLERWDGRGPEGIAGEAIPIEARVVALCDAFDSLTHDLPWRSRQSPHVALQTIGVDAGTHFDPQLACQFVEWLQEELTDTNDFLDLLEVEAFDNEYIQVRQRLNQLIRETV